MHNYNYLQQSSHMVSQIKLSEKKLQSTVNVLFWKSVSVRNSDVKLLKRKRKLKWNPSDPIYKDCWKLCTLFQKKDIQNSDISRLTKCKRHVWSSLLMKGINEKGQLKDKIFQT